MKNGIKINTKGIIWRKKNGGIDYKTAYEDVLTEYLAVLGDVEERLLKVSLSGKKKDFDNITTDLFCLGLRLDGLLDYRQKQAMSMGYTKDVLDVMSETFGELYEADNKVKREMRVDPRYKDDKSRD